MAGFSFGTPTTTAASFSFGNTTSTGGGPSFNFGSPAANPATTTLQFNTAGQTSGTVSFAAPQAASGSGLNFGSSGGLNITTPATQASLSFKPGGLGGGLTFGSNPTAQQSTLTFGSPATTATTSLFGSTPATNQQTLTFGSTPATSQPLSFGNTAPATQPLSFGSTPGTTQPLSFGSSLGTTQPSLTFGSTPTTTQTGLTPATSQPLNFGLSAPATSSTTGLSFGLAQSAVTKPSVPFGLNTTTTAAATTATTLLNFSAPKTSATTGFSLSVSTGTGTTGTLFNLPTTSTTTTTAPPLFKGLGGVDTSTTQGSGQKDAKSVKENAVFPELMPTIDALKNFVKQQKSLSCEVSRAPVKPMHKVTEDSEALRQMLTTVSSALQKNRVVANKLKIDTTKCLALCEMAQRTHDTPPGLQNDNVAPLEFFVELVSKFERDILVLRQEIDNTEKHVNSLAYPAVLTPQELSIALRRLHDSFVALAGRLQTAHSGVIAQKERHLSLRRHFLKDTTNIFATSSKAASSTKKQQFVNTLSMTGPTPFSSIGGMHNINLVTGQDKPVTFSTGPNSMSGWGSSSVTNLNTAASPNFLNTPGTSVLNNQQTNDNQNFQLGKPPPGNKRGKR